MIGCYVVSFLIIAPYWYHHHEPHCALLSAGTFYYPEHFANWSKG